LKTPLHIAPTWYFTPFYSILRATTSEFLFVIQAGVAAYVVLIYMKTKLPAMLKMAIAGGALVAIVGMMPFGLDAKFWGVVLFGGSVVIIGALPWLDLSPVKSIRYRPDWHKTVLIVFGIAFVTLGYLGVEPPSPIRERISQVCTLIYFGFFMLMPWWSAMGTFKPVPKRVTFAAH
jgi:ubiquinol-cytochrome c reductase cytochrome b subunit